MKQFKGAFVTSGTGGGKSLSDVTVGNLLLATVMRRSDMVSVTSGWTLLTQSPVVNGEQINDIYYKIADSTVETFAITVSTAGRIIVWVSEFITDQVPVEDESMSILSTTYNTLTYTKLKNKCYFLAASVYNFDSASPYDLWTYSPIVKIPIYSSLNPNRLFVWIDEAEPTAQTITGTSTGTTDGDKVIMCGVYWG